MRLVSLKNLEEGMILGKRVYKDDGTVLLEKGVELLSSYVKKLDEKGIPCVYIEDEISEDVEIVETIDPVLKVKAVQSIKTIFDSMAPVKSQSKSKSKKVNLISKKTLVEMRSVVFQLMENLKSMEDGLLRIVEMMGTDMYLYSHSVNVAIISLMIGMDVIHCNNQVEKDEKLAALGMGAILHDIGKSVIDTEILNKKGKLTDFEMDIVKDHTLKGYQMLNDIEAISGMQYGGIIKGCVLLHHENLDGSGYPYGWTAEKIMDYSRIIRVADIYAAMTSDRAFKKKTPPYQVLEQISAMCYTEVDANVFKALKARLALYPEGTTVKMNTDEKGIVTKNTEGYPDRPIIKIIENPDGTKHMSFKVIDMIKERTYFIVDVVDY